MDYETNPFVQDKNNGRSVHQHKENRSWTQEAHGKRQGLINTSPFYHNVEYSKDKDVEYLKNYVNPRNIRIEFDDLSGIPEQVERV